MFCDPTYILKNISKNVYSAVVVCMPFLHPTNPGWVLRASYLFFLGWCPEMLKSVSLFLIPHIWVCFLCLHTSKYQHSLSTRVHVRTWPLEGKESEGEMGRAFGVPVCQFGCSSSEHPQQFMGRILDGVQEWVNRKNNEEVSSVYLMSSEPRLLCSQPLLTPQPCRSP